MIVVVVVAKLVIELNEERMEVGKGKRTWLAGWRGEMPVGRRVWARTWKGGATPVVVECSCFLPSHTNPTPV